VAGVMCRKPHSLARADLVGARSTRGIQCQTQYTCMSRLNAASGWQEGVLARNSPTNGRVFRQEAMKLEASGLPFTLTPAGI
jgi:hypothetical protein